MFKILDKKQDYSDVFNNHRELIFQKFKDIFSSELNKNIAITFQEILQQTKSEFDLDDISCGYLPLENWFNNIYQLDYLKAYLHAPSLNEIIVHNHKSIQIINSNSQESVQVDISSTDLQLSLEVLALKNKISWNHSNPFASFLVTIDGLKFRATLIHFSITPGHTSKLFLRAIKSEALKLEDFTSSMSLQEQIKTFIKDKKNILVCGPTGSGKTTLLKTFLKYPASQNHLVILEDTHELAIEREHTTYLLQDENSGQTLKQYLAYALRMRPDQIILGELRSMEIVPYLLAMNTGHNGLMSTIHANSAVDCFKRLALLFTIFSKTSTITYEQALGLICEGIDIIVMVKDKEITEVIEVIGHEKGIPYYESLFKINS